MSRYIKCFEPVVLWNISFILLLIISNQSIKSQTLHSILFAGTIDSQETISIGVSKSLDEIRNELRIVASSLRIPHNELISSGEHFNLEELKNDLESLSVNQDDIIFFFFIGHGVNKPEFDPIWPHLAFPTSQFDRSKSLISFADIFNKLQEKHPRLLITISEACNNTSGRTEYYQEEILGLASLSFSERNIERLKDLYLRSEGTVMISSSESGQASYMSRIGGYFSLSFIEVHKEFTSLSNTADWATLMEKTKLRTSSLAGIDRRNPKIQVPQYRVNVRGMPRPEFSWSNQINNNSKVFNTKPNNFSFHNPYGGNYPFLIAKIVFFNNQQRVFFVMPDNYITEFNPYYGLLIAGYRTVPLQPQFFQWDIVSYYSPYQYSRWGVDYYGRIMEWHPQFGWQFVGIVYY